VFKVVDQESKEVQVLKDCWIEDHPGKLVEHNIVAQIKDNMRNNTDFHKYFIDICEY